MKGCDVGAAYRVRSELAAAVVQSFFAVYFDPYNVLRFVVVVYVVVVVDDDDVDVVVVVVVDL